ncbi:MAG: type I-MYXAN CRISPR-associated protein Cas6/Cmx6 [Cyanobacteria bacterium SID2]|nr:type I-MYXAN CRISPR-associated protein Cas6/Cmx6 [Cyanobacteria bacterium SID2]MBP0004963.1 type I-MYXAN CRISPR-associated protein Cas6/Cmx6 [Cyanobacteria bacterium SBC]
MTYNLTANWDSLSNPHHLVQLCFPVKGTELPADHNYGLYSALSHQSPDLHTLDRLSIDTIPGIPNKTGKISLCRYSRLLIRLPVDALSQVYTLAGQQLKIGSHTIQLGNPELQTLKPFDTLRARLVTIKGYMEPTTFLDALDRQMKDLGIDALAGIPANDEGNPKRLTLKIKKYTVVGFSVVVKELSPEDSILLQVKGLGGKRRMGCGVFVPEIPMLGVTGEGRRAKTTVS